MARDLGAVLAKKLDWLVTPRRSATAEEKRRADKDDEIRSGLATAYSLAFSGFDIREINAIEDMLAAFRGYEHLRTVSTSLRTHEYWYESSAGSARLNRNLRLMLNDLGITARVAYAGNTFTVEKYLPD